MSVAKIAKKNGTYFGSLVIQDDGSMVFNNELGRKELLEFGDCVYFFYVNNELWKIGKAGGAGGFYNRVQTYKRGLLKLNDRTNIMINRVMTEHKEDTIEVYAIHTPREIVELTNPLTMESTFSELETATILERDITIAYLEECDSNTLPLCSQIN